jgi:hypothetical protein
MIIVNLKGGLGNQMFQYALGRKLSLKHRVPLKLDASGLERANALGDIYRPFSLSGYAIENQLATPSEIQALKYPYGSISKGWRWFSFKVLRRAHITFEPAVLAYGPNTYLDGYFQSPRYFNDIRETLLEDFTLAAPLSPAGATYLAQIKSTTSVSVHIRRGDYTNNPRVLAEFGICSRAYYEAAIAHMRAICPNPTFFVFSDDLAWVKENLAFGSEAIYVTHESLSDYAEQSLMSSCKHNIIANSSFSWWAGWLNSNPTKVVIAPTPWFASSPVDAHLIPPSWIQLQK